MEKRNNIQSEIGNIHAVYNGLFELYIDRKRDTYTLNNNGFNKYV